MTKDDIDFLQTVAALYAEDVRGQPQHLRRAQALLSVCESACLAQASIDTLQAALDEDAARDEADRFAGEHRDRLIAERDKCAQARATQALRAALGLAQRHGGVEWRRKLSAGDQTRLANLMPSHDPYLVARAALGATS